MNKYLDKEDRKENFKQSKSTFKGTVATGACYIRGNGRRLVKQKTKIRGGIV